MELVNALSKFQFETTDTRSQSVERDAIFALVGMLSVFAPHIAEELWQMLGEKGLAAEAPWPVFDEAAAKDDVVTVALQVMGKLRGTIEIPVGASREEMERLALQNEGVRRHIEGKTVRKVVVVPNKLVNIVAN
jgi:leucyl-tRNA synthetase